MKRKKESLVENGDPIDLEGVRTMGKSDWAVPQMLGQPGQNGSRPGNSEIKQGGHQTRQPCSWLHTWMERHFRWHY